MFSDIDFDSTDIIKYGPEAGRLGWSQIAQTS